MKHSVIILSILAVQLSGCELLGKQIGKQIDDHRDTPKYEKKLKEEGRNADTAVVAGVVNAILAPDKPSTSIAEPSIEIQEPACNMDTQIQICLASQARCWCEAK